MSKHTKKTDHDPPSEEREQFIRENAVALVQEHEDLGRRYRREITKLQKSRGDMRREIAKLHGIISEAQRLLSVQEFDAPVREDHEGASLMSTRHGTNQEAEEETMTTYERFTDRSRKVMQLAHQEAQRLNHEYLGTEHILVGLCKEGSGVASHVLRNLGVELGKIRMEVDKIVQPAPSTVTMGRLPHTPRAKRVIDLAIEEAKRLNNSYVGTEHLLLGMIAEEEGVASQVLRNLGVSLGAVRKEVETILVPKEDTTPPTRVVFVPLDELRAILREEVAAAVLKIMKELNQ